MWDRSSNSSSYKYGFNGQEKDDEIKGEGNSYDFGARIYDPRIGRFISVDPDAYKYPWNSPYNYAVNSPIIFIEDEGKGPGIIINNSSSTITITGEGTVIENGNEILIRGEIVLEPGDIFEVQTRKLKGKIINGGKIIKEDGTIIYTLIQDVDFIDLKGKDEFVFDDGVLFKNDVYVDSKNPEFNRSPNEYVPKDETLNPDPNDPKDILTPNKGEIRFQDPLELNTEKVEFVDDLDDMGNKTGKIRIIEDSITLGIDTKEK